VKRQAVSVALRRRDQLGPEPIEFGGKLWKRNEPPDVGGLIEGCHIGYDRLFLSWRKSGFAVLNEKSTLLSKTAPNFPARADVSSRSGHFSMEILATSAEMGFASSQESPGQKKVLRTGTGGFSSEKRRIADLFWTLVAPS
jgi:hypothetical protein